MKTKTDSNRFNLDDCPPRYLGKFRGKVENNFDPKGQGRLLVSVPEIAPTPLLSWAMMSTPVGGFQHGMFSVPPLNAGVWVEFEQGDLEYPVWTGCFFGSDTEAPKQAPTPNPALQSITLQTPTQNCFVINDLPGPKGGVQIRIKGKTMLTIAEGYIKLDTGLSSIEMIGPTIKIDADLVSINGTNLVISK